MRFESFAPSLDLIAAFQISMDKERPHDQYGDSFLKSDKPNFQNLDDFGSFSSGIKNLF
jgi:hypothetical protein